jgi:pyruvate/2-oxoglutarate/acetoin dehydrogenase E1 component
MTGVAIGMARAGQRPIHVHIRMDFLMLAMNQLVNVAAKSRYMFGGKVSVPMVVRCMIGKSWGQGAQHSQGLYSFFMHVPGIKVVAPTTPHDAKGCLIAAIRDDNPVIYVEHRILHFQQGPVPEQAYTVQPGKSRVTAVGTDVTLVGISQMQVECLRAQAYLKDVGIRAEVIDPIWLSPLDTDTIAASVAKTGALIVVDNGWTCCGASAEIIAQVTERLQGKHFRTRRMGFAPVTCPTSPGLEDLYYPNGRTIAASARDLVEGTKTGWMPEEKPALKSIVFKGPF